MIETYVNVQNICNLETLGIKQNVEFWFIFSIIKKSPLPKHSVDEKKKKIRTRSLEEVKREQFCYGYICHPQV